VGDFPVTALVLLLTACVALSAFFSGTETALMSVNRYRLRHLAREGSSSARMTEHLLEQPDRLIGMILVCNNFVNSAAAALVTIIMLSIGGESLAAIGVALFTVILIIFGEVAPKTFGAMYPEKIALPAAVIYTGLLKVLYPIVWLTNLIANGVLRLFGVTRESASRTSLSSDELRTVVAEASTVIPHRHQRMLMSILDLEKIAVDDIMVPRSEIYGIDINDDWDDVLEQLRDCRHTRIPVYESNLESLIGILHMKKVARLLVRGEFDRDQLVALAKAREPYYVPEGTSLNNQLLQFQRQRRRVAFVVDEYGDVQGLVTLEDLLEEIVGEFTSDTSLLHKDVHRERADSFVVNASASVRTLNRKMGWTLPTTGPRTLNGLIIEQLETIPAPGTRLRVGDYSLEILQVTDNAVKTVRLKPVVSAEQDTPAAR
jgi:Mg2+/Co2+ transporter CorB